MTILTLFFAAFLVVLRTGDAQAQGYHVEANRIVVEGEDWDAWTQPKGVLEKDEAGGLRPHFVHAPINACLDAADFGAEHKGGSNMEAIPNVMDGDPSTFWEPADVGALEGCWLQIDLGRCVTATKLVLRFVEEGRGDPFLHFKVEISNGGKWPDLYFKKLWGTTEPNEDGRHFEFEPSLSFENNLKRLPGEAVRYVRVRMTATRGDRRDEISSDAYSDLPSEDRGAVDYFRVTAAGEEASVTLEEYAVLPSEDKGSVRYYRRERPRLAEVEVWSLGENVMLGAVDRGGKPQTSAPGSGRHAVDGDYGTAFGMAVWREPEDQHFLLVDLGMPFWVDTIRLVIAPFSWSSFGYRIQVSDRISDVGGKYAWTTVTPEVQWEDARQSGAYELLGIGWSGISFLSYTYHYVFPPRKAQFLKLSCRSGLTSEYIIYEWQVFGEGYMPEIVLTSDLIDVGPSYLITGVDWDADTPPGTRIEVQTRTGDRVEQVKHYFDKNGVEVTEYWWRYKLPGFMKGPVKGGEYVPGGPGWSPWSRVVEYAGARFQSPTPRRYMQTRVRLVSDDPHQCAVLRSLSFSLVELLMKQATGRLSPDEVQRAGAPEVFSLQLHPVFRASDPGFDQVLIKTSPGVKMELVGVDITQKGQTIPLTDGLTVHSTSEDSLWIQFPTAIRSGGPEEIEIRFRSAIYQHGTVFDVLLGNRAVPTWQQAESETFHPFLSTFVVGIPTSDRGLTNVEIIPRSFSPNGDGVHDELTIRFTLVSVRGPKRPVVTIYDLMGRSVRHLSAYREEAAGAYTLLWDGRDDEGARVPPGVYLVRVEVHTEDPSANQRSSLQPVHVIY